MQDQSLYFDSGRPGDIHFRPANDRTFRERARPVPSEPIDRDDGVVEGAAMGALGELVRARVVEGAYPPGYKPKRPSSAMAPLPQLKGSIEALAAFLNSVK